MSFPEASESIVATTSSFVASKANPLSPRNVTAVTNATRLLPSRNGWFDEIPKA